MKNSKKTLKLGFVGGSYKSAVGYAHFVAARMDNLWQIHAGVFSRDEEENRKTAQEYGVSETHLYKTLSEMLKNEKDNLDAVVLLTPTPLHYSMILECARQHMPVISEKALCETVEQAKNIKTVIDESNSYLSVVYNYSGYPMLRESKKLVQNGDIGDVIHFHAEMPQEGFLRTDKFGKPPKPQDWRVHDGYIPTLHLDLAVHLHELIYYITGLSPKEVIADQSSYGFFDVIDNTTCLTRYTNNVQGQFWFSKTAIGHRNGLKLRIYGTKGSIEWLQGNPEELLVSYSDGTKTTIDRASYVHVADASRYSRFKAGHPAGFNEALANLYVDFHQSVIDHQKNIASDSSEVFGVDLALEGMLWLEAMQKSMTSRKWEKINE